MRQLGTLGMWKLHSVDLWRRDAKDFMVRLKSRQGRGSPWQMPHMIRNQELSSPLMITLVCVKL